ncbi:MAG: hypothetical protein MRT15_03880 [archaeon YNP-LCB-003-016]|uniref:hypothetical protein n=1 Tax=Candidatus Culexarchaeum yellowstonense TaxID=2928963 RepID=UPI0026F2EE61|nr:hypothetical protein [Candidatus Culexarchaeum yellowstonense]MCR6691507.1 hypothetical protein [Candidatus Culexarchaeum yellowstonense]
MLSYCLNSDISFSDFKSTGNAKHNKFMVRLEEKVYGGKMKVWDYDYDNCWTVHLLPTIECGGERQHHMIVAKFVPELGFDNVKGIVEETVKQVLGRESNRRVPCDSRTLIIYAWKPTQAQRVRVKELGVKGWLRPFKIEGWFVEPVIFRGGEDEEEVEKRIFNVLSRMLARLYGARLFRILESMNINPKLYDYKPGKILESLYTGVLSVYRENLKCFIERTCKLILECKSIIGELVRKAKAKELVREAVETVSNASRTIVEEASKLIVSRMPIIVSRICEDHKLTLREKYILEREYKVV